MNKLRSFPELCAECGLFPVAPPVGHIIAALDEPLHRNAMAINMWRNAKWHTTGYLNDPSVTFTPRELHRIESFLTHNLVYFSFANPIL